jgi:hypothetical protein
MLVARAATLLCHVPGGALLYCRRRVRCRFAAADRALILGSSRSCSLVLLDGLTLSPASYPTCHQPRLEYLLSIGTGVLFLLYIPLFAAAPRLATQQPLMEEDLMWFLPLLMMCACLVGLCNWAVQGPTTVGRILWTLAFGLAMVGCPVAHLVAMMSGPDPTRSYSPAPPAAPPPPVPVEPMSLP